MDQCIKASPVMTQHQQDRQRSVFVGYTPLSSRHQHHLEGCRFPTSTLAYQQNPLTRLNPSQFLHNSGLSLSRRKSILPHREFGQDYTLKRIRF
ncbi:hypothetical protein BO221_02885 [Archangium sp. Cb G35]|nr:hypothetical protein BO221_02885 [Archangium sp. Cb G35]